MSFFIDLAGSKWASYLPTGIPGFYLPDVLLAIGCAGVAFSRPSGVLKYVAFPIICCWVYVAFQSSFLADAGSFWIRDTAPFLYLSTIPFVAAALSDVTQRQFVILIRSASLVMGAVIILTNLGLTAIEYGGDFPLFETRQDVDNVVLGIGIISFGAWRSGLREHRWIQLALFAVALGHYSRAGLIACLICVAISVGRQWGQRFGGRGLVFAGTAGISLILLLYAMLGFLESISNSLPQALGRLFATDLGTSTTGARIDAWRLIYTYVARNDYVWFGSGPGSQPVRDSGALFYLSGDEDVRAPHNWILGCLAYHGLVGLAVHTFVLVRLCSLWRRSQEGALCAAAVAAYYVAGLLGVVIESPFGSLPVAVFLARLLALSTASERLDGSTSRGAISQVSRNTALSRRDSAAKQSE